MAQGQIKTGVLLSYLNIVLTTVVGLIFTPFLLSKLGQSEYGLYMLIGSLIGYISVLDFGLQNTIYRFISNYQAEKNFKKQENFLATCFLVYSIISLLVLIIGTLLVTNLDLFFSDSLTNEEFSKAKIMGAILVFNLSITLPLGSFQYIASGYGKFNFVNIINISRLLLRTIVIAGILLLGYKSIAIVIIDTIFNISVGLIYAGYCFMNLNIKVKLYKLDRTFINEILNYSFFTFILAVVNQLFWKIGQVTLGMYSSTIAVAMYALSMSLVIYYQQFSLAISNVFMPKVSELVTNGASGEVLTNLMIRTGRVQLFILGIVLSGFFVLGDFFIDLWVGKEYMDVYWITLIIFIPVTIPMIQTLAGVILQVQNKHIFKAKLYLIMSIINIPVSILLGNLYGPLGVGISTALFVTIFQIIIINFYYKFRIGINVSRFFQETLRGILPTIILTIVIGHLVITFISKEGWLDFFISVLIITLIYITFACLVGLNKVEKEVLDRYRKNILMKLNLQIRE